MPRTEEEAVQTETEMNKRKNVIRICSRTTYLKTRKNDINKKLTTVRIRSEKKRLIQNNKVPNRCTLFTDQLRE